MYSHVSPAQWRSGLWLNLVLGPYTKHSVVYYYYYCYLLTVVCTCTFYYPSRNKFLSYSCEVRPVTCATQNQLLYCQLDYTFLVQLCFPFWGFIHYFLFTIATELLCMFVLLLHNAVQLIASFICMLCVFGGSCSGSVKMFDVWCVRQNDGQDN